MAEFTFNDRWAIIETSYPFFPGIMNMRTLYGPGTRRLESSRHKLSSLARIPHHPSTATFQWRVLAGFRSVGVLDIVLAMPARSSVAKATHAAPLIRLATNGGEKCGLGGGQQASRGSTGP